MDSTINIPTATEAISYILQGVGRLFYVISPKSTSFATFEEVPDYIAEAIPFFVLLIVLEFVTLIFKDGGKGLLKERSWNSSRYSVNDSIGSIGAGMLQQISKFFIYDITVISYLYVYENFRIVDLDPFSIWVWIASFFLTDLAYYLFHRAAHEINIAWATHVVHHSSEYYNQTTALRQSIFQPYVSWIFNLPSALFIPPSVYAVHKQFNTLFQFWIHTEVVGKLGPLEYIINTPSAHRVHHGRNPYCIDKNFAGTLIIWDIIFGTFELERTSAEEEKHGLEPVAFGLTHPIDTFDPLTIQFHHLRHVLRTCWSTSGLINKFKVLFYGPGWHDDTPRTGLIEEIPLIAKDIPPQKYDPSISLGINIYVVTHFILVIIVNALLLDHQPGQLDFKIVLATTGYIFSTLTIFGRIFDRKAWAIEIEFIRSLVVCGVLEIAMRNDMLPQPVIIIQLFHLLGGAWIINTQKSFKGKKVAIKKE